MHRRKFIAATGGFIAAGGALPMGLARAREEGGIVMPANTCRSTIRLSEGPFLTPESLLRSDIREDRAGTPIRLTLKIVDHYFCTPIEGAVVDIWQSDAKGLYSGVDNFQFDMRTLQLTGQSVDMRGTRFLRGHQISDKDGKVEFVTIFPGLYTGRVPHIHLKTIVGGVDWMTHVTQLFLPSDIERAVFQTGPYGEGGARTSIGVERDLVVKGDQKSVDELTVALERDGDGFKGTYVIAMDGP